MRVCAVRSLWILKRTLQIPLTNSMNPILSLYDYPCYKNLTCPRRITHNPCPKGYGVVILKDIISGPFNYAEQNGYLEILIGCVGEKVSVWGGLIILQSLSTIKKGTSLFNFQSNESFFVVFMTTSWIRSALV